MPKEMDLTVIAPAGDLLVEVRCDDGNDSFSYRADAELLRQSSPYFGALLGSGFSEGARVIAEHGKLRMKYGDDFITEAPADKLPRVCISNIGKISKVNTIKNITADFLRAVHGLDLAVPSPPIQNIANLAIVADRFDALPSFSKFVHRKKYLQTLDAKTKPKPLSNMSEERVRQRLLTGILLDHPPWVTKYSKQLIMNDSVQWKPQAEGEESSALWWDIPRGVEDEMIYRRECVLETISSLQSHFLKLYTSGERQCKLGYDTSVQCDSFQLGEMVRFFIRLGTLRLQGTIYNVGQPPHYSGDIDRLLESLRQCPSYQLDKNHSHCGLRARLIPLLDLIQNQLGLDSRNADVGLCAECWNNHRAQYAWSEAKRPLLWTRTRLLSRTIPSIAPREKMGKRPSQSSCLAGHVVVRDMFTAVERDWTAKDAY